MTNFLGLMFIVKRPNGATGGSGGGGTVRKHTIKKLNGDTKTAKSDINQNNAPDNATSANDTLNLSDSTIQALQDALHYKPLSQIPHGTGDAIQVNTNDPDTMTPKQITAENNQNNNNINNVCSEASEASADDRALFQGISLKDFEKHHKLMKEANLEKRRLLSSAIEQR